MEVTPLATDDAAAKKSVWLLRRVAVIREGSAMGEIEVVHINDPIMVAGAMSKYLTHQVWSRHAAYITNSHDAKGYAAREKVVLNALLGAGYRAAGCA